MAQADLGRTITTEKAHRFPDLFSSLANRIAFPTPQPHHADWGF
jgi:hypothetical protein